MSPASFLLVFALAAAGCSAIAIPRSGNGSDPGQVLFSDFWTWRLERSPEFASLTGSKEHNSHLEIFTLERFEEDRDTCFEFIEKANWLLGNTTDEDLTLNLEFFVAELQTFVDGFPYHGFLFPIDYLEGVQVDFQKLAVDWVSMDGLKDYQDLISRYNLFLTYAEQIKEILLNAVETGQTNHNRSMNGVLESIEAHLVDYNKTIFWQPFIQLNNVSEVEATELRSSAKIAIEQSLQGGFSLLHTFLKDTYMPAMRPEIAVSSLPGGPEFYKACLHFHTSSDLTPEMIHQRGKDEVERIEGEMRSIISEMGHNMTLQEFAAFLRNDPNNFFNSGQELLDAFHDIIENKIDGHLLEIFNKKPSMKLEITEATNENAPAAVYIAGTQDGKRPGRLFVNTFKFGSQPRYEMVSLSLHETTPGHHQQASYMTEQTEWPQFRKVMEDRIYNQVPSRFPINTAYTEGWGLYSETLGFDMGLYDAPLDRYGHYSEEIFRACRLVVDTGMHALGWRREDGVKYMLKHTAASQDSLEQEIDRYITWPGQATGYKIGQMKIQELRKKAETQMGDGFDIKGFHEVVLRSPGPLNILEKQIDKFIAGNQ
jgi:uncharacterized protein (DUF885 family)